MLSDPLRGTWGFPAILVTWWVGFRRRRNCASSFGRTSKFHSPNFDHLYSWPFDDIHLSVTSALILNCFRIQIRKREVISMESIEISTCSRTEILVLKLAFHFCMYSLWAGGFIGKKMGVWCQTVLQCQMVCLLTMSPWVKLFIPLSLSSVIYTTASKRTPSPYCCGVQRSNKHGVTSRLPGTNVYSALLSSINNPLNKWLK